MKTRVIGNQSLFDIATEKSGSVLAAFDWAVENGISITDILIAGEELTAPETEFKDAQIEEYFSSRHIATSISNQESIVINYDFGIGAMIIEDTFIVR